MFSYGASSWGSITSEVISLIKCIMTFEVIKFNLFLNICSENVNDTMTFNFAH